MHLACMLWPVVFDLQSPVRVASSRPGSMGPARRRTSASEQRPSPSARYTPAPSTCAPAPGRGSCPARACRCPEIPPRTSSAPCTLLHTAQGLLHFYTLTTRSIHRFPSETRCPRGCLADLLLFSVILQFPVK